jgi:hypothetical protein
MALGRPNLTRRMKLQLGIVTGTALAVSAAVSAHDRITTKVTWEREISRIIQARCVSCHVDGGRAPMPLGTYAQARPWAKAIRDEVLARRMPVWHAARGYGDFANDPSLSPFEIALIAAWADGGAPKGEPRINTDRTRGDRADRAQLKLRATYIGPDSSRKLTLRCGDQALTGTLFAVRPMLAEGASAAITAQRPNGRRDIVAWIRNYDPGFPTTYWLRTPLVLPPGSRIAVDTSGGACSVTAILQ